MRKTHARWLVAVLVAGALGACGDDGGTSTEAAGGPVFPMTVQNCGHDVVIPKAPAKILTIGHEAVEEIVEAGGADLISARAGENPPEPYASKVKAPSIASGDPSGEELIGTGVDMVISYGLFDIEPQTLTDAGITSLIVSGLCGQHGGGVGKGASFQGVMDDIELFGRIFGTEETATKSIASLEARLDKIKGEFAGEDLSAAGAGFFRDKISLAGKLSMANAILQHLGLTNVFGTVEKDFDAGSVEELIDRNPDAFILYYYDPDETADDVVGHLKNLPGAADMNAVKNGKVITYRYKYSQASPSAVTGAEVIAEALRKG